MHRLTRRAPMELVRCPEPAVDDRSGPPLTQGFLLTIIATVAARDLSTETLDVLSRADPDAWYHGQIVESLMSELEERDPSLPYSVGRSLYLMMRGNIEQLGLKSTTDVLTALPSIWHQITRGDSGAWRSTLVGPRHARIEAEQPYNCLFEEGAARGLIESVDVRNVVTAHRECMRSGATFCVFDVRWDE